MSYDLPHLEAFESWLAAREAAVGGIREGCAKQVIWADGPAKTPLCVVYIHGFSATSGEVRPLPDLIADALGANLYFARLTGHGQDGAAMGRASNAQWDADVAEALAIGAALGDEVIVMGCSTGCTLLTSALARGGMVKGAMVKGIVHLSPNFGLRNGLAQMLLQLPGVRKWGPYLVGKTQSFDVRSPEHAQFWTLNYDTQAVFTMAQAVRVAMASAIETISTPAYFAFGDTDRVVSPKKTRVVMARWAGPTVEDILVQGPEDDSDGHVMAGDVLSPRQTAPLAARISAWIKGLG